MEAILHDLGIDLSTLIIQAIGFLCLFLILNRYVFGKIGAVIEDRKREIRDRMAQLEADQQELKRLQEEVRQRLTEIELEARSRIQTAIEEANAQREKIQDQAARDAERELIKAREEIQREKNQAIMELRAQVGDLAMLIAGRVLESELDQTRHRDVIDEFINQLPSSNLN